MISGISSPRSKPVFPIAVAAHRRARAPGSSPSGVPPPHPPPLHRPPWARSCFPSACPPRLRHRAGRPGRPRACAIPPPVATVVQADRTPPRRTKATLTPPRRIKASPGPFTGAHCGQSESHPLLARCRAEIRPPRRGDWMWWEEVRGRERGELRARRFEVAARARRAASLALSNRKEFASPHHGAVNSLQVDLTEGRYLLSGASDGSAAVFDVWNPTEYEVGFIAKHRNILLVDKQHENGHRFAVSGAIWYPVDTGLFVTASYDQYVKVWDTNSTQVVMDFKMPGKVYTAAMSPVATTHMLIATGSADVQVRLCDIASGAFTHTLSGHRDGIMSLEWSASSEWILMSGGCDGAIRFWDIRRAGCFRVLDQSRSQLGRRPSLLERTTENDHMDSLGSSSSGRSISAQKRTGNAKNSPTMRKSQKMTHGQIQQRLHPGLSSSQNRATTHYGAVTGLRTTPDGMYLLSSGSDSRLRLWDIDSGCNTLVNYEAMRLQTGKTLQLAVTDDPSLVFVPCMASIKAYNLWSGTTFQTFRGHYELVNCCYYSTQYQELYTGSNDRQILVWSPSTPHVTEMEDDEKRHGLSALDEDNWSD